MSLAASNIESEPTESTSAPVAESEKQQEVSINQTITTTTTSETQSLGPITIVEATITTTTTTTTTPATPNNAAPTANLIDNQAQPQNDSLPKDANLNSSISNAESESPASFTSSSSSLPPSSPSLPLQRSVSSSSSSSNSSASSTTIGPPSLPLSSSDSTAITSLLFLRSQLESARSKSPMDVALILDVLNDLQLHHTSSMNSVRLQQSGIGMIVNKLAKIEDIGISKTAKALVQQWKMMVLGGTASRKTSVSSNGGSTPGTPGKMNSTLMQFPSSPNSTVNLPSSAFAPSSLSLKRKPSADLSSPSSTPSSNVSKPLATSSSFESNKRSKESGASSSSSNSSKVQTTVGSVRVPQSVNTNFPSSSVSASSLFSSSGSSSLASTPTSPFTPSNSLFSSSASKPLSTAPSSSSSTSPAPAKTLHLLGKLKDPARNKTQSLLFSAFSPFPSSLPPSISSSSLPDLQVDLAIRLESAMYSQFPLTTMSSQYKSKYRDLVMNLKDEINSDLKYNLYCGIWNCDEVVKMSVVALASRELKEQREKDAKWEFDARRSDLNKMQSVTDAFRCGKCKERKCTYYQKQTRSADEPMTTFVQCQNCNNRWRC